MAPVFGRYGCGGLSNVFRAFDRIFTGFPAGCRFGALMLSGVGHGFTAC